MQLVDFKPFLTTANYIYVTLVKINEVIKKLFSYLSAFLKVDSGKSQNLKNIARKAGQQTLLSKLT